MPSVSATGFRPLGVTFAVWFVVGGVTAEGTFTLEVGFVGGGGAGVAETYYADSFFINPAGLSNIFIPGDLFCCI